MMPVTLARMDNYNGFLGSFDNVDWWLSEPLPGDVDTILDASWVGGSNHVCAARMMDGTYAIFRSPDNGYSWELVLSTAEKIFCLIRPNYDQCLAATSGGWWRTVTGGTRWTKISTQAPNCFCVKEITKDILIALDGTYVWRSINVGVSWTKAVAHGTSTPVTAITKYPSLDGTSTDLLIGCTSTNAPHYHTVSNKYYGPFTSGDYSPPITTPQPSNATDILLYSEDGGISFYHLQPFRGWCYREAVTTSVASKVPLDNGWETDFYRTYKVSSAFPRETYTDIITDIELTGVNDVGLCQFVIQVLMANGLLRHYWVRTIVEETGKLNAKLWPIAKFDARSAVKNSLISEEVQYAGSTEIQDVAIFSGMAADYSPLLMSSPNGGEDWTTHDVINAKIYTGPDLGQLSSVGGPFLDDNYIDYAWRYPICHNGWHIVGGHLEKCMSYDTDVLVSVARSIAHQIDTRLAVPRTIDQNYDVNIENTKWLTYRMTRDAEKTLLKTYSMTRDAEKTLLKEHEYRLLIELVSTMTYEMESRFRKTMYANHKFDEIQEKLLTATQDYDVVLVDSDIAKRASMIERKILQPFKIGRDIPPLPWAPYSSRVS